MPLRSLFFCVLLLFSVTHRSGAAPDRLKFYYNIAEGNYLISDLSGAARGIEQSLRLDPAHAPSLALKAKVLLDQAQAEAALEAAEKAIEAAPLILEYQLLRGLILGQLNQREEALRQIEAVLDAAEPSSQDAQTAQHLKGLLMMAGQEWDEAAVAFKESYHGQAEDSPIGRQLAAEAYLEKARTATKLADALTAIDQAIALYEDLPGRENLLALERFYLARAKLLAQDGQTGEAIRHLESLTRQNPDNLEATVTLASIHASEENWEAISDLIAPIAQNPQLADVALYLEGRVALSRDRVGTARAKFEEALEINQNNPTALKHTLEFYRSICLERLTRGKEAEESLIRALDGGYQPESAQEAIHLGRLLLRVKKAEPLIPILERALLRDEANPEGWALLGRAHLQQKQSTLALSALNQSLAQKPEQAECLALRGSLLRQIGDLEGALTDYQRALRLSPSSPVLNYEQGLVLLQLGRVSEAEPFLQLAAKELTTHPTLNLLHACCAYALGKYDAAAQSLRKYLQPEPPAEFGTGASLSETAHYLHLLLGGQPGIELPELSLSGQAARLYHAYGKGEATRKEVLDWAGRADTPEAARRQICSAAFWLAQFDSLQGQTNSADELLKIALEYGTPDHPEWQFAHWQLAQQLKAGRK